MTKIAKTIGEAFDFVIDKIEEGTPMGIFMAAIMLKEIKENVKKGRKFKDKIILKE